MGSCSHASGSEEETGVTMYSAPVLDANPVLSLLSSSEDSDDSSGPRTGRFPISVMPGRLDGPTWKLGLMAE